MKSFHPALLSLADQHVREAANIGAGVLTVVDG